jgi:hypothetical protein
MFYNKIQLNETSTNLLSYYNISNKTKYIWGPIGRGLGQMALTSTPYCLDSPVAAADLLLHLHLCIE